MQNNLKIIVCRHHAPLNDTQSHRYLINRIDQTSRSWCFEAIIPVNNGFLAETSVTQQLTKINVKQSHLLLICKGWSFIKQNNLWLLPKMAKLFYQVKEENFSAKISNWEHSRYCGKNQTILFSMLPSQHLYRKFDLFYLWDICAQS